MLSAEEIESNLSAGYERREFEVKGPGSWGEQPLSGKVIRAVLGMGNLRDGGHIVIGIADDQLREMTPGLSPEQLESWLAFDDLADAFKVYADPPIRFDVVERNLSNGSSVAIIQVFEFADLPHVCTKGLDHGSKSITKKGALYVRPRGKPSTTEIASSIEMREVLDLAAEKRVREFLGMADRAGVAVSAGPTDGEKYELDRRSSWDNPSPTVAKIKSRNHWFTSIAPERYVRDRLAHADLDTTIGASVVRLRGWPVPDVDDRYPIEHGDGWIGQDLDAETVDIHEAWRYHENGEFDHLRSVSAAWRSGKEAVVLPPGYDAVIEIWEVLYYLTEVCTLAARLAFNLERDEQVQISAHLVLTSTTALVGYRNRAHFEPRPGPKHLNERVAVVSAKELVSKPNEIAIDLAAEIFARFSWKPRPEQLATLQQELFQ